MTLSRRTPMPPRSAPMPRGGLRTVVPVLSRNQPGRKPRTTGGNSHPTAEVRRLVLERDGYACVRCGRSVLGIRYSLGHRKRASQGGRAVPSDLLTFCGWGGEMCHGDVDLYRDPADEAKGYRLRSWQDPAAEPVMLFSPGGSGTTVWLDDLGNYLFEPPEGLVA